MLKEVLNMQILHRNVNNKEQQVVADRLSHIRKSPARNKVKDGFDPFYYIAGGAIALFGLIIGFVILPRILANFPLHLLHPYPFTFLNILKILGISALAGVGTGYYFYYKDHGFSKVKAAEATLTAGDKDDAEIDKPTDLTRKYNVFPDEKVHADINVTALLSHMNFLQTHGVKGKDGKVRFDNKFGDKIFDMANLPKDKQTRIFYNTAKLDYNPTFNDHDKPKYKTVQDYINNNWYVPDYEDDTQDPAGGYIVSTTPENTVVVSETRGGKGVKYIEPILDIWSRQKKQPNIVITDLKMELLRMYLRTFTLRGYNVKALNLMVPSQTDAINFIGYAVDAAITGDMTQMEKEVSSVSDVFFVNKGKQDPMWNNAASATFKRTIYLLINYYNEKVKALREDPNLSIEEINHRSDELWGKVTLYNAYRFTVDMAGRSYPKEMYEDMYPKDASGNTTDPSPEDTSKSALTVYCDAIDLLPQNSIRSKISDQNKPIVSVAPSEKTLASVYAVCMFGMIFFTDSTIIRLTSARPSANLDLKGFAFPRRVGVSFNKPFADRYNLVQAATVWQAYHDPAMTDPYKGDDFRYEGNINDFRWAYAYFKGKFDDKPVYLKLTIYARNGYLSGSPNNLKIKEFDFVFRKSYRKSYSGRQYLSNQITGEREVQGGEMHEYTYDKRTQKVHQVRSGIEVREHSLLFSDNGAIKTKTRYTIEAYDIHYTDKPTALFLVTSEPSYNKVLLMTLNNLYNQQVALCKLVFPNQKPVVPTKYLLDEFGNIKSEGQGVPELDTKLDSGLGFEQQFTLILQSLSQLTTLYDNAVKETLIANSANFFFMKSKDKNMIHQLMDMNGKVHKAVKSSVTVQQGQHSNVFGNPKNHVPHQGPSLSISRNEQPLLSENDYLRLNHKVTDGNAIVSRGDSTIVSIRDTCLPVSFQLLANNLGKHGALDSGAPASLPTMSDTNSFNALQNIPDFDDMVASAMEEAKMVPKVIAQYKKVEHKTDRDIELMDPDVYADIIMAGVRVNLKARHNNNANGADLDKVLRRGNERDDDEHFNSEFDDMPIKLQTSYTDKALDRGEKAADFAAKHAQQLREKILKKRAKMFKQKSEPELTHEQLKQQLQSAAIPNKDFIHERNRLQPEMDKLTDKCYANKQISRLALEMPNGTPTGAYDDIFGIAFANCYASFNNDSHFILHDDPDSPTLDLSNGAAAITIKHDKDGSVPDSAEKFQIEKAFIDYLISLPDWHSVANGRFEAEVISALNQRTGNLE